MSPLEIHCKLKALVHLANGAHTHFSWALPAIR